MEQLYFSNEVDILESLKLQYLFLGNDFCNVIVQAPFFSAFLSSLLFQFQPSVLNNESTTNITKKKVSKIKEQWEPKKKKESQIKNMPEANERETHTKTG